MELTLNIKKDQNVCIVALNGPLDSSTYMYFEQQIRKIIDDQNVKALVLDMKRVNYISSLGVGVIFMAMKVMKERKGSIAVVSLQPQIQKLFEIVKAMPNSVFETLKEVDDYLASIQ